MKRIKKLESPFVCEGSLTWQLDITAKINEIIEELNSRCPLPDVEDNFWEKLSNEFYESKLAHEYKDGKIDYRIIHQWFVTHNISK